ncbi:MAG TPA: hypothetical protein VFQ30_13775 [Ktedonobacteraceae bacterium]|nr:hypothetical protein [Ktedonobacteraceae bacterium]
MRVLFRSKDFASVETAGLGFGHRHPDSRAWHYRGKVQHAKWQGNYVCHWEGSELLWIVQGDALLFGLAAALKSRGLQVEVEQDQNTKI